MKSLFSYRCVFLLMLTTIHAQRSVAKIKPASSPMNTNNQEALALVHDLFNALVKSKQERCLALCPSNAEFKTVLQQMMNTQPALLNKEKMDQMLQEREQEAPAHYRNEFQELINSADRLGIDWARAVFEKLDYNLSRANQLHSLYLNGCIFFLSGEQHFMLDGIEAMQIGSAYKLQVVKGFATTLRCSRK